MHEPVLSQTPTIPHFVPAATGLLLHTMFTHAATRQGSGIGGQSVSLEHPVLPLLLELPDVMLPLLVPGRPLELLATF